MATTWGNYRSYNGSARHFPGSSPSVHIRDARLTLLDGLMPGLFQGKKCLDIGCNAGTVSCQLAFDFEASSVTGIDIDPELVSQAQQLYLLRSSRLAALTQSSTKLTDYFPISAVLQYGHRSDAEKRAAASGSAHSSWPHAEFIPADWVASTHRATTESYEVILALSVVKWIHLEHGDEGLTKFFEKCCRSLVAGGFLILEVQPWSSYEKAVQPRKAPHFKAKLATLKYRPETSYTYLLQQQGFNLCAASDALPRRISVYCKG